MWKGEVTRLKACGLDGRQVGVGYYDDEVDAALAVDAYLRRELPTIAARKVNFPTADEVAACAAAAAAEMPRAPRGRPPAAAPPAAAPRPYHETRAAYRVFARAGARAAFVAVPGALAGLALARVGGRAVLDGVRALPARHAVARVNGAPLGAVDDDAAWRAARDLLAAAGRPLLLEVALGEPLETSSSQDDWM